MKTFTSAALLSILLLSPVYSIAVAPPTILAFDTMYGVDGPFLASKHHPLRGRPGDDLPWAIGSGKGTLDTTGHLVVHVRGLVFKDDPSVPVDLRGINDAPEFRAAVSCITEASEDVSRRAKVVTQGFPATVQGDADIDAQVVLPNPCIAPIVFVLPGDQRVWFAVNGLEAP